MDRSTRDKLAADVAEFDTFDKLAAECRDTSDKLTAHLTEPFEGGHKRHPVLFKFEGCFGHKPEGSANVGVAFSMNTESRGKMAAPLIGALMAAVRNVFDDFAVAYVAKRDGAGETLPPPLPPCCDCGLRPVVLKADRSPDVLCGPCRMKLAERDEHARTAAEALATSKRPHAECGRCGSPTPLDELRKFFTDGSEKSKVCPRCFASLADDAAQDELGEAAAREHELGEVQRGKEAGPGEPLDDATRGYVEQTVENLKRAGL